MITVYHGKNVYLAEKQINDKIQRLDELNVAQLLTPTLEEIRTETNTAPLFGTRRLIIIYSLQNIVSHKQLIGILENKRPTSHVIFVITEYGKKHETLAAYLRKFQVIKINQFDAKKATLYLTNEAKKLGLEISAEVANYLIFLTGNTPEAIDIELNHIASELQKNETHNLLGHKTNNIISIQNVRTHVTRRSNQNIFALTDKIFMGDVNEATDLINVFVKENPANNTHSFLNLLISDLKLAIIIKSFQEKGKSVHTIPGNTYRIKIISRKIRKYSLSKLINFFMSTNRAVYSGIRQGNNPLPIFYDGLHQFRGR